MQPSSNPHLPRRGLGGRQVELLERIADLGSISRAAKAVGLTYKAAWEAVEAINNLSDAPLVERTVGGRHGGGAKLTAHGQRAVEVLRHIDGAYQRFLDALGQSVQDFDRFYGLMTGWITKTSARNQFFGKVAKVKKGAVNAEVVLSLGKGNDLVAIITNESVDRLGLHEGSEAYALIKAPWIILTHEENGIRTSARNCLCGTVVRCREGAVNAEVALDLGGGKTLVAIITNESVRSLRLKEGGRACGLIKASHVILAVGR
jgi:molybdate transport system regulatory protein